MRADTPKEMQPYLFHERKKGSNLESFAWPVIETFRFFVLYFNALFYILCFSHVILF